MTQIGGVVLIVFGAIAAAWYCMMYVLPKKRSGSEPSPTLPSGKFAQKNPAQMAAVWEKMVAASGLDTPTAIEAMEALQVVNRRLKAVNAKETDPQFVRDVNSLASQLIKEPTA